MDMRAFAVLALAAVLAAAAGAAATEASVDAHELAGSCDDGRKAPVMLVDKLPGGGAPCCKGSLCPLVGGVCCPGSTHCCPSGTKCAPLRGHGEGQKCSVSGFHASAHPEALAAEQRRRAEAPEPPPALHVQIVQARSVKQMTREQLAREVGITAQKMLEYELAEEAPPADVLNRISQTLGVTLLPPATANGEEEKEDYVPVAQRAPIAVAIEEARKGRSLSRKELGAAVGVSEAQVLSFEDGSAKPTQKQTDRIGAALNADMPDPNLPAPVNVPDLSKVLPSLRQKRGLSVGKLARVAGIRPAVVRGMENGKVVPTKQLRERLDKALDANLEQATKPVVDQAAGVTLEAEAVPDSGSASSSTSSSGPDGTDTDGSEASGAGSDGGDDDDASSSDEAGASGSGSASDSEDRQAFTQSTEEKAEKKADDERASAKKAEAEAKQVQQAAAKQQAAATKKEQPAKEQPKQAAASKGAAVKGDARSALMGALGKAASGDGKAAAASDAETAARAAAAATRQASGKPQNSKEAQRAAELRRIAQDEKVADAVAAKKAADEKEAADERARRNREQAAAHAKADALRAATEASKQRVLQLAKEAAASRANLARATSEAQGALKTARDATKAAGSDEGRAKAAVLLRAARERAAKARAAHAKATAAKARAVAAHKRKVAQLAASRRKAAQAKARHDAAVKRAYQWVRTGPLVQLRVAYASQFCLSAARPRGAAGRPSAGDPVRAAACGSAANKWRLGRDRTVRPAHNLRLCLESHARRTLHLAPCKRGQASQRFVKAGHLLRGAHGCVRAPRNLVTGQLARSGKCTGWRAMVVPVRPGSPQPTPARRWLTRLPRSKSRRRCVESAARNARFLTCDKRNRRLQWRAYPDRTVRPAFAPNLCLDARGGSGRPARALPCAPRVASQRWVHSRSGRLRSASGLYLFHRSPAAPKHGEPLLLGRFPNAKAARRAAPLRWRRVGAGFGAPKRAARRAKPAGKRAKKAGKAAGGKTLKKTSKGAKKKKKVTKTKKKAPERRVGVYVSGPAGLRPAGRVRLSPRVSYAGRSTLRVEAMSARPFTGAAAGGLRLARNTWYVVQLVGRVDPRSSKGALVCPRVAASGSKFAAFRCLKGTSLQRGRYHKVNVVFRTPARDDSYTVGAVMQNQRGGDAFYLVDLAVVRLGRSRRPSRARGSTAVVARFGGGVAPLSVRGRAQVRTTPDSDGLTLTLSRPWRKNVAVAARELDLVKGRTYEVVLRGRLARGPGLACSFVSLGKRAVSRGCSKALSLRVNASKDSAVVQRFVAPATGRATVGVRLVKHNSATVARVRALVVREVRK